MLESTRNTPPVFPRHTCRQVLSSSQRAAVGGRAQPLPTFHVGLLKFAPSGSMSMMSHRQQASNKEIPSIWRLTEWWCHEYPQCGKMGGGAGRSKFGARSPAAHLSHFIVFQSTHHSVADGRRQRNLYCPFFRGIPAVRFYLPVSMPRLAIPRSPSPHCMWGY